MTLEEFFSIVESIEPNENGCLIWPKGKTSDGYAQVYIRGIYGNRANRIMLELKLKRKIKDGFLACHTCDNPVCINPEHLWEGTNYHNMKDKQDKRRAKGAHKGEEHYFYGKPSPMRGKTYKNLTVSFSNYIRHVPYWGA